MTDHPDDNSGHSVRVPFPFADDLEAAAERMTALVARISDPPRFRSHAEEIDAVVKGIHPDLRGTV